jgi:class 3 adenylate cyclase
MDVVSPKSQRRNLAILFSDLCDSTRISGSLEPEQFADLLEQLRRLYDVIVARHGGLIVRIDGDGVICAFGYPTALEDAGRRATEAALDLHAGVAALDQSFAGPDISIRLHSGVHSGVVLVREGDMVRGRIEILGDTTNVAARLCDHARADQIVVSEASLGGDRHFFMAEAGIGVPLKGRKTAIPALLIKGRDKVATRFAARSKRGMAAFCGRDEELARLRELLAGCIAGDTQTAMVAGPAGIGKTRLVSEFLDEATASGIPIHRGYCEAYLGARPLQPFEQIVHAQDGDQGDVRERTLAWAREDIAGPAIIAIDDWHWADDASHMLLGELREARTSGLLVILASRPDAETDIADEDLIRIELGPLSDPAASAAISGLLRWADPFRAARIRELSGGSPLFIEELCHAQTARLPGQTEGDSSVWLDMLVHARFLDLPERQAELVRIASVIGHMVPLGLFAAVTGIGANDPVLEELNASDFLYPGEVSGTLRFKHALARDAIYRTVGLEERKRLHGLVADQLEALAAQEGEAEYLDSLAYHHGAAGQDEVALPYAIRAGDAALAAGALDRAQAHYQAAFVLLEGQSETPDLVQNLRHIIKMFGRSCVIDPGREHVPMLEHMLTFAESKNDSEAITLATYWIGAHYYGLGEPLLSLAMLERAYELVQQSGAPSFIAQVEANLGQSYAIACRYDQAIPHLDRAISKKLAVWRPALPSSSLAYSQSARALVLADMGQFEASERSFDESWISLASSKEPIIASLEAQRSLALNFQGCFEAAEQRAIPAEDVARKARSRALVYSAKALASYARLQLTAEKRELDNLVEVAISLLVIDQPQRISFILGWITEAMADRNEEAATRLFARLTFQYTFKGDRLGEACAARALASLAARSGGRRDFRTYLRHADRAAAHRLSPREAALNRICEANCLHWSGEYVAASTVVEAAADACATLGLQNWQFAFK